MVILANNNSSLSANREADRYGKRVAGEFCELAASELTKFNTRAPFLIDCSLVASSRSSGTMFFASFRLSCCVVFILHKFSACKALTELT